MRASELWEFLAKFPNHFQFRATFDDAILDIADIQAGAKDLERPGNWVDIELECDGWLVAPDVPNDRMIEAATTVDFRRIDMPEVTEAMIGAGITASLLPPDKVRAVFVAMWSQAYPMTNTTDAGVRELYRVMMEHRGDD